MLLLLYYYYRYTITFYKYLCHNGNGLFLIAGPVSHVIAKNPVYNLYTGVCGGNLVVHSRLL